MAVNWALAAAMFGGNLVQGLLSGLLNKYPKEYEQLSKTLGKRGIELAQSPGYTQDVIDAMFGREFENIRAGGRGVRQSTTEALARGGMTGTGTALKAARENAWANQNLVTQAMRDIMIAGEQKKAQDIALASQIMGGGVQAELGRTQLQGAPDISGMLTSLYLMGAFGEPGVPTAGLRTAGAPQALPMGTFQTQAFMPTYAPQSRYSPDFLSSLLGGWN